MKLNMLKPAAAVAAAMLAASTSSSALAEPGIHGEMLRDRADRSDAPREANRESNGANRSDRSASDRADRSSSAARRESRASRSDPRVVEARKTEFERGLPEAASKPGNPTDARNAKAEADGRRNNPDPHEGRVKVGEGASIGVSSGTVNGRLSIEGGNRKK